MWSLFRKVCASVLWLSLSAVALHAQRRYTVGPAIDLSTGGSNTAIGLNLGQTERPFSFFYALYPSLTMISTNPHSAIDASYTFGFNRTKEDQNVDSKSHSVSLSFSDVLSPTLNVHLSESFLATSDAFTFNALRGISTATADIPFLFFPVAVQQVARTNSASAGLSYRLTEKSTLSLNQLHNLR